jgi:hypothetical protein
VALVTGGIDFGERINDRLPFDSPVFAGMALATIVAIPLTVLAWSAWTGTATTNDLALVVGLMLIGWISVQVVTLRSFSPFQPAYLCVGAFFVAASNRMRLGPTRRGILFVTVGAIVTATGVGLVPHLIRNGLTIMSVVSVVGLLVGIALMVEGARSTLRDRHLLGKVAGTGVIVFVLAVAVTIVAPAVAATNVSGRWSGWSRAGRRNRRRRRTRAGARPAPPRPSRAGRGARSSYPQC